MDYICTAATTHAYDWLRDKTLCGLTLNQWLSKGRAIVFFIECGNCRRILRKEGWQV